MAIESRQQQQQQQLNREEDLELDDAGGGLLVGYIYEKTVRKRIASG